MKKTFFSSIIGVVFFVSAFPVCSQESYTSIYNYPLSIGVTYQMYSPLGGVERTSSVSDVSARVRVPLRGFPILQPFALIGFSTYESDESDDPIVLGGVLDSGASIPSYDPRGTWDHMTYNVGLGLAYSSRISKQFEFGAELAAGLELSSFNQRIVDSQGNWYPVGELGFSTELGGKISLNPSYNISLDITPSFRYSRSLGNLHDFDGFYFGIGFGGHYRFGVDPDSPGNTIRAIQFFTGETPAVFAAMQKVYINTPLTIVRLKNTEKNRITNIEVSFNQAGYMDSPTLCAEVDSLESGEEIEVPILAGFNEKVFSTVDVVPLNGEISVTYTYRSRTVSQNRSLSINLHDKNALVWDDDRKVAAFITPKDSAVRNYASFVADKTREERTSYLPDNLETAMIAFHSLAALDLGYQSDPASPFQEVQGSRQFVDSVSLSRETLIRGTGDCDDLTVLYNTMLESLNVPTGFVTIPGHIYAAVDTGLSPRDYRMIHPDRSMSLSYNGTLWILVEITLIGRSDFLTAWTTGMNEWNRYAGEEQKRALYSTLESQEIYRPVGLQESDIGLQYGNADNVTDLFKKDRDTLSDAILASYKSRIDEKESPQAWNQYGSVAAQLGRNTVAERAFLKANQIDRDYLSPVVNLGSVKYLTRDFSGALSSFQKALSMIEKSFGLEDRKAAAVMLKISVVLEALERNDEADRYVSRAREIDPQLALQYGSTDGDGSGRASEVQQESLDLMMDFME